MKRAVVTVIVFLPFLGLVGSPSAHGDSVFVLDYPTVDFQVIDADDGDPYYFDGIGDFVFPTYGDVALGSIGEARSMVEYDLSAFSVPAGETITGAFFEVRFSSIGVFGMGIDGETPDSLAVEGYLGNGIEEESDFQIANGNLLDSIAPVDPQVGDILSFDVTSYVAALVQNGDAWLGLTLRAESFGGYQFWEYDSRPYPILTIVTAVPEPGALGLLALAVGLIGRRG